MSRHARSRWESIRSGVTPSPVTPSGIAGGLLHVKLVPRAILVDACVLADLPCENPSNLRSLPYHLQELHSGSPLLETTLPGHHPGETSVETWSARADLTAEVSLPEGEHLARCTQRALQLSLLVPPDSRSTRALSDLFLLHRPTATSRIALDRIEPPRTNTDFLATAQLETWSQPSTG